METTLDKLTLAEQTLQDVVSVARTAFGENLLSALVFGSAANGQLRISSDVNLMLVLKAFQQEQADQIRDTVRLARATVDLHVMFIIHSELPAAVKAFTAKFADIKIRHRLLYGSDPFLALAILNEDLIANTRQALLNFQLRTREHYIVTSLREEQLVQWIADSAAVLRSCAAALVIIRGGEPTNAKAALEEFVASLNKPDFTAALQMMSQAREQDYLAPGTASKVLMNLLAISQSLYESL